MLVQVQLKLNRVIANQQKQTGNDKVSSSAAAQTGTSQLPVPKIKSPRGFVEFKRKAEPYRPARERVRDWDEIFTTTGHKDPGEQKRQAARCMDCGTPFCQTNTGCPINNLIPEWNELVLTDQWKEANERLHKTNNFPEFTGRVCPAPCEGACVAGLIDDPVTIKNMEYAIVDRAWKEGWIKPQPPKQSDRTGMKVAVVGSGPAGLTTADQLNKMGHSVTVFERQDRIGGLLMYGIPTMKLDKDMVDRRVNLLRDEGIKFVPNTSISSANDAQRLTKEFDAIVLAVGAAKPRDLNVPGRNLSGIVFAMDYLTANQKDLEVTKNGSIRNRWDKGLISAKGKDVVVIGGGDTGTDCIGTSLRHYCKSLVNLELLSKPPPKRDPIKNPWPLFPKVYKEDYGHEESRTVFGNDPRIFSAQTKSFLADHSGKNVKGVVISSLVETTGPKGEVIRKEVPGSEKVIPADLVVLAMGFLGPEESLLNAFDLKADQRGNIAETKGKHTTTKDNIFACGDCAIGQSLVVTAISQGRSCADKVDEYLMKRTKAN